MMAAANYDACLKQVLKYEGGYTNHPSDPGGPTNWGITIHDARKYWKLDATAADVKAMPLVVAKGIYRKQYWDKVGGDGLHDGVDLAVFDYGVNSGVGRALPDFKPYRDLQPVPSIKGLCARRLRFLKALRTWPVFGAGWGARVASVEAIGVKMALTAQRLPAPQVKKKLETEAKRAGESSNASVAGGAATGGVPAGAAVKDPSWLQWDWLTVSAMVVIVGALIFLGYKAYIHYQRKKAYVDAAATV